MREAYRTCLPVLNTCQAHRMNAFPGECANCIQDTATLRRLSVHRYSILQRWISLLPESCGCRNPQALTRGTALMSPPPSHAVVAFPAALPGSSAALML